MECLTLVKFFRKRSCFHKSGNIMRWIIIYLSFILADCSSLRHPIQNDILGDDCTKRQCVVHDPCWRDPGPFGGGLVRQDPLCGKKP